jgi:ornithine cyclodeaminase
LPPELLAGARIVVEDREAAWREYGDLIMARAEGAIGPDAIAGDLAEAVLGRLGPAPGRTVFKSAGMAWEDLAVACRVYQALTRK